MCDQKNVSDRRQKNQVVSYQPAVAGMGRDDLWAAEKYTDDFVHVKLQVT